MMLNDTLHKPSYVTGFAKRGLPHTFMQFYELRGLHNLGCKAYTQTWNFLHLLTYVSTHCCLNFKALAISHLKLWIARVSKLDVCGRPLFTNIILPLIHSHDTQHLYCLGFTSIHEFLIFQCKSWSSTHSLANVRFFQSLMQSLICYVVICV